MYDINVIKRYFESIYETREIENIPAKELNVQLAKFFMNVRKRNGSVYEPTSLKDFQRSLQRYLNDKSSTMNILQDQVFAKSREVLIALIIPLGAQVSLVYLIRTISQMTFRYALKISLQLMKPA